MKTDKPHTKHNHIMNEHNAKRRRLNTANDTDTDKTDVPSPSNEKSSDNEDATTSNQSQNIKPDDKHSSDEEESNGNSSLGECRLRHGLNIDCLCEVFKFLDVYDLIQLCNFDIYFQTLIKKWVIGKKLVNFTKMDPCWTTDKIFKTFGETMRNIRIGQENTLGSFEHFLNFVIKYCTIGGLTNVDLRFSTPKASNTVMEQSMPYFSNLRKLVLNDNYSRVSYDTFLAGISTTAKRLTHLTLEGVNVTGEWLVNGLMNNLREFRLNTSKRRDMSIDITDLCTFLRSQPNLELFSYVGDDDITDVAETMAEYCTKLKTYVDFQLGNPHDRRMPSITAQMMHRYSFIRKFKCVTTLGITSYTLCGSDLYYPLVKMAAQNQIETLKIYVDRNNAIILPAENHMHYSCEELSNFTRLKLVELQIKYDSSECDLNGAFICEFVSKLNNVEQFRVMSEPAIWNINKILEMAPNLNELDISHLKMKYLPVEMRKIICSIRKRRNQQIAEGQQNISKFHLKVNEQQWREVQVYKDANIILKLTVEQTERNHSFKVHGA